MLKITCLKFTFGSAWGCHPFHRRTLPPEPGAGLSARLSGMAENVLYLAVLPFLAIPKYGPWEIMVPDDGGNIIQEYKGPPSDYY